MGSIARTSCDNAIPLKETCPLCNKPVIAIILNFIIIFKVYPKLPESRRKTLKTQVKLIRAQNLPSLLLLSTNIVLSTLLIQGSMQDACHMNFVTDLAHRGVSVAQWLSIGARNPKVWGSIPHGNWEFFLCPTLVTRRKKKHSLMRKMFASYHERGLKKRFWVPVRNRTSDLRIPRFGALSLSHRDSTVSKVYYDVHMTRVLCTARISDVDSVML